MTNIKKLAQYAQYAQLHGHNPNEHMQNALKAISEEKKNYIFNSN